MIKKIILLWILLSLFLWASCGLSSNSVEALRDQYSEAIDNRNFDRARSLAEKADRIDPEGKNVKFVNEKEIFYLLADNSRNNADRIFYMFNSFESSQLPDMEDVLKVAASQGNEYLAVKLVKSGIKPNDAAINAAVINELNELLLVIVRKDITFLQNENLMAYARGNPILREYSDLYEVEGREKEIKEFDEDLKELLSSTIPSRPATGLVKSNHYGEIPSEYTNYNREAEKYNDRAMKLLVQAMALNQRNEAQKIISSMKPTLEWKVLGDWTVVVEHTPQYSSVYNAIQVSESHEESDKARKLLNSGHVKE